MTVKSQTNLERFAFSHFETHDSGPLDRPTGREMRPNTLGKLGDEPWTWRMQIATLTNFHRESIIIAGWRWAVCGLSPRGPRCRRCGAHVAAPRGPTAGVQAWWLAPQARRRPRQ